MQRCSAATRPADLQANCSEPVPPELLSRLTGTQLVPLKPQQCLILAHAHLLPVAAGALWVDHLALRFAPGGAGSFRSADGAEAPAGTPTLFHAHRGTAWATNVTVQGDGAAPCSGVALHRSSEALFAGARPPPSR